MDLIKSCLLNASWYAISDTRVKITLVSIVPAVFFSSDRYRARTYVRTRCSRGTIGTEIKTPFTGLYIQTRFTSRDVSIREFVARVRDNVVEPWSRTQRSCENEWLCTLARSVRANASGAKILSKEKCTVSFRKTKFSQMKLVLFF